MRYFQKLDAYVEAVDKLMFACETAAHLRGLEKELLPYVAHVRDKRDAFIPAQESLTLDRTSG